MSTYIGHLSSSEFEVFDKSSFASFINKYSFSHDDQNLFKIKDSHSGIILRMRGVIMPNVIPEFIKDAYDDDSYILTPGQFEEFINEFASHLISDRVHINQIGFEKGDNLWGQTLSIFKDGRYELIELKNTFYEEYDDDLEELAKQIIHINRPAI